MFYKGTMVSGLSGCSPEAEHNTTLNQYCTNNGLGNGGGKVIVGNFLSAAQHVEIGGSQGIGASNAPPTNIALDMNVNTGKAIKIKTFDQALSMFEIQNTGFTGSPTVFQLTGSGSMNFNSVNNANKIIKLTDIGSNQEKFVVYGNGKTGINNSNPYKYLTVNGDVSFANYGSNPSEGSNGIEILGNNQVPTRRGISTDGDPNGNFNFYIHSYQGNSNFNFKNGNGNINLMRIEATGKVFIGAEKIVGSNSDAKLQVDGKIASKALYVLKPTSWADHVFYNKTIENLNDVEKYINTNNHLPGLPSEKEILENGYDINQVDALLLEKIEKLYLYIIQQQKQINELKEQLKNK